VDVWFDDDVTMAYANDDVWLGWKYEKVMKKSMPKKCSIWDNEKIVQNNHDINNDQTN